MVLSGGAALADAPANGCPAGCQLLSVTTLTALGCHVPAQVDSPSSGTQSIGQPGNGDGLVCAVQLGNRLTPFGLPVYNFIDNQLPASLHTAIETLARRARISLDVATPSDVQPSPQAGPAPFGLTDRELAVLRLLGDGHSNDEIGAALFISPKTASVHVTNILRKLAVNTRAHAAAVAARHNLFA